MTWLRLDPAEFWALDEVVTLDVEAAGLYWWLVCRSWNGGAIHDDPEFYKAALRGKCPSFDVLWTQVRARLVSDGHGGLRSEWLESLREESATKLKSDAERKRLERAGKPSAKPKRKMSDGVRRTETDSIGVRRSPLLRTDGRTDETDIPSTTGASPCPTDATPAPASSGSPTRLFTDWWSAEFLKVTGARYAFEGAKDGAIVKKLLERSQGDLEDLRRRAMILLHAAPEWVDRGGKNLGTLLSNWNRLVSQGTGHATGSKLMAVQAQAHAMNGRQTSMALPPSVLDALPTTKVERTV